MRHGNTPTIVVYRVVLRLCSRKSFYRFYTCDSRRYEVVQVVCREYGAHDELLVQGDGGAQVGDAEVATSARGVDRGYITRAQTISEKAIGLNTEDNQ